MQKIEMVEGDIFDLPINIIKPDRTAQSLVGASVKFLIKNADTNLRTNDAANDCVVLSAPAGQVQYTFAATDCTGGGVFLCDVKITFPSARPRTIYDQVQLIVRAHN